MKKIRISLLLILGAFSVTLMGCEKRTEVPYESRAVVDNEEIECTEKEDEENNLGDKNTIRYGLYPVSGVIDGETFSITVNGIEKTIRLIGIEIPQNENEYAISYIEDKIKGQSVYLEFDMQVYNEDNEMLAYVYLPSGIMLQQSMIEDGVACAVVVEPNVKYADSLEQLMCTAKSERKGMWISKDTQ